MSTAGDMYVLLSDAVDIINDLWDRWEPQEFDEDDKELIQRINNFRESYKDLG